MVTARLRPPQTIVGEYFRFPSVFLYLDTTVKTTVSCFRQLFSLFGLPPCIQSDRGHLAARNSVNQLIHDNGIATNQITPQRPQAIGQPGCLNGKLWKPQGVYPS